MTVEWLSREQREAARLAQQKALLKAREGSLKGSTGRAIAGILSKAESYARPVRVGEPSRPKQPTATQTIAAAIAADMQRRAGIVTEPAAKPAKPKLQTREEAFDAYAAWIDGMSPEQRAEIPGSSWYQALNGKTRDVIDDVLTGHGSEDEALWFGADEHAWDSDDYDEGHSAEYGDEAA